jgi:hypothetical protein
MLFNGGSCDQSFAAQNYYCQDFEGGPPILEGEEVFAVATANGEVLTSSIVAVGESFTISTDDQNTLLPELLNITVYDNQSMENRLQSISFNTSCASPLFPADIFGSMQIVEFENQQQGLSTLFQTFDTQFEASIEVAIRATERARLEEFTAVASFGVFNLTNRVNGDLVDSQTPAIIDFPFTIDLAYDQRYTMLISVTARGQGDLICREVFFFGFDSPGFFGVEP